MSSVIFTNKRCQAKVSTVHIFTLLVAGHNYLQGELSKYTAVHLTPNRESTLHQYKSLINWENVYISIVSYITVRSISPVLVTVYQTAHPT